MRACDAKSCRYIYFLFDNAFYQVIGHNNDEADPGRGYNVYSLKWFFETYFSEDEYRRFELALKEYIEEAKDYIGYSTIKTLSQNSLVTFKKITENTLLHYPYENLKAVRAKQYELFEEEFKKVRKQFIEEKKFLVMLGSMDFSESLITAEWLYDSMKKAKAIDLTIIGMGYFKSVEQLLYSILKINECESVSEDINLGSMAHVFKDNIENTDLIRDDLVFKTRRYIRETIFDYANLRNGYLHKHNIHEWTRINEIRDATFRIIFLLLGGCNLNDEKLTKLGYSEETFTDYYRLCEYINFHSGELFYLDFEENGEQMGFGVYDRKARFENGKTVYSGFYIKELSEEGKTWCFVEEHLPKEISLGKFVFRYDNGIKADPVKVKVIFKDGRFVGPSIAEEDGLDY